MKVNFMNQVQLSRSARSIPAPPLNASGSGEVHTGLQFAMCRWTTRSVCVWTAWSSSGRAPALWTARARRPLHHGSHLSPKPRLTSPTRDASHHSSLVLCKLGEPCVVQFRLFMPLWNQWKDHRNLQKTVPFSPRVDRCVAPHPQLQAPEQYL